MISAARVFSGSIGKKTLMAVTGLLLSVFLVSHLAGNLLLFKGEATFNAYAKALTSNPLLPLAEVGLAAIFILHIVSGLRVSWENLRARPTRYEVSASAGNKTIGSGTMAFTGILLLVFLAIHLYTFRINHGDNLYLHVMQAFQNKVYTGFYVLAMLGLTLHMSHGFQSAFQTLGLNHPKYTPAIKAGGWLFAAGMLGFAVLAIWSHFQGGAA